MSIESKIDLLFDYYFYTGNRHSSGGRNFLVRTPGSYLAAILYKFSFPEEISLYRGILHTSDRCLVEVLICNQYVG